MNVESVGLVVQVWESVSLATILGNIDLGTTFATAVLVVVTCILARETHRMARASVRPFVTVTIEPNGWSLIHCDMVVENSGNSPAYDVKIKISPEPPQSEHRDDMGLPLQNISVVRPGQRMRSFLSEHSSIADQIYTMEVSWKRHPRDKVPENIVYEHCLPKNITILGAWSPEIEIARQLEKIRKDWKEVASASRKLSVDTYDREDRAEIQRRLEERRKAPRKKNRC